MAAPIVRGKAVVAGVNGTFDAYLYSIQQTGKATQNWEEEIIKDADGADISWLARNEHLTLDWGLKLVGDTVAHAMAPAQVVAYSAGSAGSAVSSLGQPFLAPLSAVNFTATSPTQASFTGTYQVLSGNDVDIANTKVGDLALKLRRYAASAQNTLANTVPS